MSGSEGGGRLRTRWNLSWHPPGIDQTPSEHSRAAALVSPYLSGIENRCCSGSERHEEGRGSAHARRMSTPQNK